MRSHAIIIRLAATFMLVAGIQATPVHGADVQVRGDSPSVVVNAPVIVNVSDNEVEGVDTD